MAKSARERKAASRESIKNDPEKYKERLERERMRDRKGRKKLLPLEKLCSRRERVKQWVRKCRELKKAVLRINAATPHSDGELTTAVSYR